MKLAIPLSASLLVLASIIAASSLNDVKKDIIAIDTSVDNLYQHSQVQSLNYFTGLAIREAADSLTANIKTGAECVQHLDEKPTDKDANLILSTLGKTEGKVKLVVDQMIRLKPQFEKLGVVGIAAQSVGAFQTETKSFANQLVKLAPAQEQKAAVQLAASFNKELKRCNDAYNPGASTAANPGVRSAPVTGGASGAQQPGATDGSGARAYGGGASGDAGAGNKPHGLLKRRSRHGHKQDEQSA
ncbi:uncharacterized protein SPSC_05504 [Sporisorium scitamineum]|uniref:Cell wall protein n=1 Tax=Sporisorium scitamineum TaxID=49012 RepID=A0A0F7RZJ7_9BASI|nr:hypothetical protein [Sporisorium scitamineum]CDU25611.1 uncharacterized protein SPSC_05504 [Sporisorium scitamineum]